jgi:peptidyl-prolyl cis-trans isomerase C
MENMILAKVDGKEITQKDREFFLGTLGPERSAQFSTPEGLEQILQELINQELLFNEAKQDGLDKTDEYALELEKLESQLLKSMALRKVLSTVAVTEDDLKNHYESNKEKFQKPMQLKASHILVKTEEEGQAVLDRLNAGETFEAVATEASECPSKERGGDLGYFAKGAMVPEFEQATMELDKDQISGLVQTQFGYHVIKLVDRKEPEASSFEEVSKQIEQEVYGMRQGQVYQDKINTLRSSAEIEIITE